MEKMTKFLERLEFNMKHKTIGTLRLGQLYFLSLTEVDVQLADSIRATVDDCFYVDKKIPLFIEAIKKAWGV